MWASAQTEGGEAVNMPDSDIRILYEDSEILLVQKPAGMPSQPDPCGQPDLLTVLARRTPVWLVHRLDTPTGGVMVFARTSHAAAALSRTVQDHERFVKEYLCVLPAAPQEPEGVLADWLYHDSQRNRTYPVAHPGRACGRHVLPTARSGSLRTEPRWFLHACIPGGRIRYARSSHRAVCRCWATASTAHIANCQTLRCGLCA